MSIPPSADPRAMFTTGAHNTTPSTTHAGHEAERAHHPRAPVRSPDARRAIVPDHPQLPLLPVLTQVTLGAQVPKETEQHAPSPVLTRLKCGP
ncbi:hypothetical protein SGFS_072380 [Streptomyces graminofaciens]|uniref:Uncharacterized protein n=1 Tax=Streptomyces graminofaciens TaxID=68212 RepID=A0ABM7FIC5_9ACTN|nr:hypothetical protein SGFS_072380 [Streptomyces graminofaciens]